MGCPPSSVIWTFAPTTAFFALHSGISSEAGTEPNQDLGELFLGNMQRRVRQKQEEKGGRCNTGHVNGVLPDGGMRGLFLLGR